MTEKKQLVVGIVAHVDAGKTTLSEGFLYTCGSIRKLGRVDHQNAFLDTHELERGRGITIFSKQAILQWKDLQITLVDTPGHVDFSAEMERTLQVLDYAILVISGVDGIQGHTETLMHLLREYRVPTFIFVNKMDQEGTNQLNILHQLQERLQEGCIDFTGLFPLANGFVEETKEQLEQIAMSSEELMETYLAMGKIPSLLIAREISGRKIFPCYFGAALHLEGVEALLDGLLHFTEVKGYPQEFGARVYKIARDEQGTRLSYLKVTGGCLRTKDSVTEGEKVNQIRLYSGAKYIPVPAVTAGMICAVTGLESTYPGQGLGMEAALPQRLLEPILIYQIQLPLVSDVHKVLRDLRKLEEEEPELRITWQEQLEEIHACLMGEVQTEILKARIKDRFNIDVTFGAGNIIYRETIQEPVVGVGHFEPLRHYAEVHLLLEPAAPGSGLEFATNCSEDVLDRSWQYGVLHHLAEKEHKGVLTGSSITDMKITLLVGKAHKEHTSGGDFREATYRALRQGLMKAESILLEPVYSFRIEVPTSHIGRVMADVQRMHGRFNPPETKGDFSVLTGSAPVATMRDYQVELLAYTGGRGRIFQNLQGYEPCHNRSEVIAKIGYDAEADLANPSYSVFCAHGAGFVVLWHQVEEYMHLENDFLIRKAKVEEDWQAYPARNNTSRTIELSQEELDAIYVPRPPLKRNLAPIRVSAEGREEVVGREGEKRKKPPQKEYLLVDGYNIIFAWEELRQLGEANIEAARDKLMDILCNYQGYRGCTVILVFDAYKVEGHQREIIQYHNIYVVYTKEAETADQYIEKTVREIGRRHQVTVATSDALEQMIIMGQGAFRMSAKGLREEIEMALKEMREEHLGVETGKRNYLFDFLGLELSDEMERVRLGKSE